MNTYAFFRLAVVMSLSFGLSVTSSRGSGLKVGPSESIQIGIPGVETNILLDFLTVQPGGKIEVFGNVKLTVLSNVVIDGLIFSLPTAKQTQGEPGIDGQDAVFGQSAAYNGTLGGNGTNWFISSSLLTINSQADIFINGAILFQPKLDGGDGGPGGRGGHGAPGAFRLGNKGGDGGAGGLPGLVGSVAFIARNRLELGPASIISLDNLGVGGTGGPGGDGGNGGNGLNGETVLDGGEGGNGGPIGEGGPGGDGRSGGSLRLRADVLSLKGLITARGSSGGKGGNAGHPSAGGKGGNAGPTPRKPPQPPAKGGDGGNAGNGSASFGYNTLGSGRGGSGGSGGSVTLDARVLIDEGIVDVSGGLGGKGGDGWEAGAGQGGLGGSPGGAKGLDSPEIPPGTNGPAGAAGLVLIRNPWAGVLGTSFVIPSFLDTSRNGSFRPSVGGGDGSTTYSISADSGTPFRIAARVNTGTTDVEMLELVLNYRWASTSGSLEVTLGGTRVLHLEAPTTVAHDFSEIRVPITDRTVLNRSFRDLVLLVTPSPTAEIEIANFVLLTGTDRLRIDRSPKNPGMIDLSWFGFTNKSYQLQTRSIVSGTEWINLLSDPVLGRSALLTNSQPILPARSQQYFRLLSVP